MVWKMAEKNNFDSTVESLFKGMESFITSKTVVGDAIKLDGTTVLPLIDVSFGVGAGASNDQSKNNGGGGMGGKMSPSAVLVIKDGEPKLVNIKEQDGLTKVLDMVPGIIDKFAKKKSDDTKEDDSEEISLEEQEISVDN